VRSDATFSDKIKRPVMKLPSDGPKAAMEHAEKVEEVCNGPSILVRIFHKCTVLLRGSIGLRHVKRNLKADSATSYAIGCCSKVFTATALNILVEEKELFWEENIQSHISDLNPIEDPKKCHTGRCIQTFDWVGISVHCFFGP
jgi:CubicO group peptidase (beta-lactamase class C family)